MTEFSFGLVVSGTDFADDDVINGLIEAGLDDASFAIRDGAHVAYLDREGDNFFTVLVEAVTQLESALPGARVCGLDAPDFMSASGVAGSAGRSRQSVHQHINGLRGSGFPPPIAWADGERPLWLCSDVSRWTEGLGEPRQATDVEQCWPGVASGAFHLARAACSLAPHTFVPAMSFLVDRYLALGHLEPAERQELARRLRDLADSVTADAGQGAPVHWYQGS